MSAAGNSAPSSAASPSRQHATNGNTTNHTSSLEHSGVSSTSAQEPVSNIKKDLNLGQEDDATQETEDPPASGTSHLLHSQSTSQEVNEGPLPSTGSREQTLLADMAADIGADSEYLAESSPQARQDSHAENLAFLIAPPELSSIRTPPASVSPRSSNAHDDVVYHTGMDCQPHAAHSPSYASPTQSPPDTIVWPDNNLPSVYDSAPHIQHLSASSSQQSLQASSMQASEPNVAVRPSSEASSLATPPDLSGDIDSSDGKEETSTGPSSPTLGSQAGPGADAVPKPEEINHGHVHAASQPTTQTDLPSEVTPEDAASSQADSEDKVGTCRESETSLGDSSHPQLGLSPMTKTSASQEAESAGTVAQSKDQSEPDVQTEGVTAVSLRDSDSPHTERQDTNAAASTSGISQFESTDQHTLGPQADVQGGISQAWRQHRKHVFILSNAGKPIWTLHGDENSLAGLMAVIQALTSFVQDKGDTMKSIRAGKHLIVLLERGPFILVMVAATGEPEAALMCQLGLIHGQILSILSSSVEKMFTRNPSYDARKLLGATNHVLTSLVTSFDTDPSAMLKCLVPLPLKNNLRHYALVYLQAAVKSAGALFGVLLTKKAIVAVAKSRAHVMHPHDLLLLANLVRSNDSFKQAQTFTPVCLPHFNAAAFLHAYVQYLDVSGGVCLVLLSSDAESFFRLADAAQEVRRQLKQSGVLQAIVSVTDHEAGGGLLSIASLPAQCGGGRVGMTPLLHFLYKSAARAQAIMPAFDAPLDRLQLQQVAMQKYATVHTAMTQKFGVSASKAKQAATSSSPYTNPVHQQALQQQVHWCSDGSMSALAYAGPEYELYALFDAMTDKETATRTCHRLSVWIKGQQADLFMPL